MKEAVRVSNMCRLVLTVCVFCVLCLANCSNGGSTIPASQDTVQMEVKRMVSDIHWLGHASFRIEGDGLVIYIDPWQLGDGPKADGGGVCWRLT